MKKQIEYLIDSLIEKDKEIKELKGVINGLKHQSKEQMQTIQDMQQSARDNIISREISNPSIENIAAMTGGEVKKVADLKPRSLVEMTDKGLQLIKGVAKNAVIHIGDEKELKLDWDTITKDNVVIDCSEKGSLEKLLGLASIRFGRDYDVKRHISYSYFIRIYNIGVAFSINGKMDPYTIVPFQDIVIK